MSKHYREDELDFIVNNWKTMSDKEIAIAIGRDEKSIKTVRVRNLKLYRTLGSKSFSDDIDYNDVLDSSVEKNNSKWSKEDDDYLIKNFKCMEDEEIGRFLKRTRYAVKRRRNVLGLKRKEYPNNHTYDEVKQLFEDRGYELISDKYINTTTKLYYKCNKHNDEGIMKITLRDFLSGKGCKYCGQENISENKVSKLLHSMFNNIERQKRFDDCKCKHTLPFDFYLSDYNICIEYDGEQHFKPVRFGGMSVEDAKEEFNETLKRDKIKNEYCKNNNIVLIRIPYWEIKNLNNYLINELSKYINVTKIA